MDDERLGEALRTLLARPVPYGERVTEKGRTVKALFVPAVDRSARRASLPHPDVFVVTAEDLMASG